MPLRRAAWSSWNYLGKSAEIAAASSKGSLADTKPVFVTYWLNKVLARPVAWAPWVVRASARGRLRTWEDGGGCRGPGRRR